ncbi:TcaA 3rd/4th domain-containing protein [Gracilibacillus saliphilus]|uniref:TcaA 3rd/4th domain-containing protein n=1 Tax=Gracilibacillus saliphilus TaxID=543890 RepID=UPI0013D4A32A|nr:hypothetical protein [Gracilibacillus saliphilus]
MKFCKQCGEQVGNQVKFCKSCGTELQPEEQTLKAKKPINTKKLFIILSTSIMLLAAILVGGCFFAKSQFGKKAQIEEFKTAIQNGDTKRLTEILTAENITSDYYERFITYFVDKPDQLERFISEVETEMIEGEDASMFIDLQEQEKILYLFPQYQYQVQPVEVSASANFERTNIHIPDYESVQIEEPGEIIHITLLPDEYNITFTHDEIYGNYSKTVELNFWESNAKELEAAIQFDGNVVELTSNYPEAALFINGEAQAETIADTKQYGPVTYDGTTTFQGMLDLPWDTYYTDEVAITDSSQETISLDFEQVEKDIKHNVYDRIGKHTYEWVQAYRNKSINALSVMRNQDYLDKTSDNFDRMDAEESNFNGDIEQIRIDNGSFSFMNNDGQYQASVIAELQFYSGYYETGHRDELNRSRDQYYWEYQFEYDPHHQDWFIVDSKELSDFETKDIIVY